VDRRRDHSGLSTTTGPQKECPCEPVVSRLRLACVKGFDQVEVDSLDLVPAGVVADRRFVIADADDRVLYSSQLDALAGATAGWRPGPDPVATDGEANGSLELRLPGRIVVGSDVVLGGWVAGRAYADRPVRGRVVEGPFGEALSALLGRPVRLLFVPVGVGSPGAITVLGDGSLARLAEALGVSALDPRRFRMTVELVGVEPHGEDAWRGTAVRVGAATLLIGDQVPRCALTTRDPDTRVRDHDVLRALLAYRERTPDGEPPFGVYATVEQAGTIRLGDPLSC
jgi:uncharacterized protein